MMMLSPFLIIIFFSPSLTVPPAPLSQCQLAPNSTKHNAFRVVCRPGFDGGLPQTFVIEVRPKFGSAGGQNLIIEHTSDISDFIVTGLTPATLYVAQISAVNAKGRSDQVRMEVMTKDRPINLSDIKYSYSAGEWSLSQGLCSAQENWQFRHE